jgi:hypothetical protein
MTPVQREESVRINAARKKVNQEVEHMKSYLWASASYCGFIRLPPPRTVRTERGAFGSALPMSWSLAITDR